MPRAVRSESSIQRAVVEWARGLGFIAIKQSTAGRYGSSGWPDYLFLTPSGGAFFVEFKREGLTPTPLQHQRIRELNDHNVHVYLVDNAPLGKKIISDWAAGRRP